MTKAERDARAMFARERQERRRKPVAPEPAAADNGLRATVLSPTRLRLDHAGQHWLLRCVHVDKARVWLVNDGSVTLAALWRVVFTGVAPNLTWLQEQFDLALNGG